MDRVIEFNEFKKAAHGMTQAQLATSASLLSEMVTLLRQYKVALVSGNAEAGEILVRLNETVAIAGQGATRQHNFPSHYS